MKFQELFKGDAYPTEEDTPISVDHASWYRWEELIENGFDPRFVNYTNYYQTKEVIQSFSPSIIIYAPTIAFERSQTSSSSSLISNSFKSFLALLEAVKDQYPLVHVCLVSYDYKRNELMKLLELALSSYSWLYSIKMSVIRVKNVVGTLGSEKLGSLKKACDVKDLSASILSAIVNQKTMCRVYDMRKCSSQDGNEADSREWNGNRDERHAYETYLSKQTRKVVMSTYFTKQHNPQYKLEFKTDNFYFIENWYLSSYKLNLQMVIFHDDLSDQFIKTFTKNSPNIEFVKVHSFHGYTPNDRRYFVYYNYLLSNRDISHALMTDLRDVKLLNDPFKMMKVLGDFVYFGLDIPFQETPLSSKLPKTLPKCYTYYPEWILGRYGNLNPGVLGGKRSTMLWALNKYTRFIEMSSKLNCNTPAAAYLFLTSFYDDLFFGWPLQSGFMTDQPHPPGLSVLHKWNNESW